MTTLSAITEWFVNDSRGLEQGWTLTAPAEIRLRVRGNLKSTISPQSITFGGQALSSLDDTDGDGLNDASEFQMAALGFDWQVNQRALVNTLTSNLNGAGYFTPAQVQALHIGTPLLQRDALG